MFIDYQWFTGCIIAIVRVKASSGSQKWVILSLLRESLPWEVHASLQGV